MEKNSFCLIWKLTCRLEYPGVSPELSFLKDIGRAEFHAVMDEEALDGNTYTYIYISKENEKKVFIYIYIY